MIIFQRTASSTIDNTYLNSIRYRKDYCLLLLMIFTSHRDSIRPWEQTKKSYEWNGRPRTQKNNRWKRELAV